MGQGQGNREDGVRPGSQGLLGFPWSPSLCGCRVVVKEAWPESRRRPSGKLAQRIHHGGQLVAVEVCRIYSSLFIMVFFSLLFIKDLDTLLEFVK